MLFGSRKDKVTEAIWCGDSVFGYDLVPVEQLYTRLACPLKVVPRYIVRDIPTIVANPAELVGKRLVIIGRSSSGKTREAIELIRKMNLAPNISGSAQSREVPRIGKNRDR